MKSKKRWLAVLLCLAMAVTLFGCSPAAPSSPAAAPADSSSAPAASADKVKITYANWGSADEIKTLQGVVDKFNATHPNIEVEIMPIPHDGYVEKLNTMATAGQLPDTGIMIEQSVIQWAQNGMLADVSSMYGAGDSKPMENLAYKYQGKTVAYASANEIITMYYNKDMFDKAGVPYAPTSIEKAWTWDEFVTNAKKLTLDKNGKHPDDPGFDPKNIVQYGCMIENLTWQLEWPILSNGGSIYSADGTKLTIGEPAAIEAIQKIADLSLKYHVAPLSAGTTDDGVQRSLIAKTCAMTTNGTWNVGTCLGTARQEGLNYGIAVLPYMKQKATISTAGANVVFSQSKHQKEAMEWIKWYYQEENGWDLIKSGIWMPLTEKYYTDETLTRKWVENPNFPPYDDYKAAVVDAALDKSYTHSAAWFYANNTVDVNNLLQSILGDVWTGKTTAQEAITSNLDKLQAAFQGK